MSDEDITGLFEPIDHGGVADEVVEQIETLVLSGILKQGARLPAERELSEALNVSRPKLREALKRLEADGLVVTRHGEGTIIAPLVGKALSPALTNLYARNATALADYHEYRRAQEGFAAALAAERATAVDREIIAGVLERLDAATTAGDLAGAQAADIDFHAAIVDSSHNTMLIHMMASVFELTQRGVFYNRDFLHSLEGSSKALLAQHHAIAEAVFARDPEKARQRSDEHIGYVETALRRGREAARRTLVSARLRLASETR